MMQVRIDPPPKKGSDAVGPNWRAQLDPLPNDWHAPRAAADAADSAGGAGAARGRASAAAGGLNRGGSGSGRGIIVYSLGRSSVA